MAHQHHHGEAHPTENIKIAFFLNLGFTIIEIIGGIFTNSLAIISDAIHDLGDSISLGIAWYFQKLSHRKKDEFFSYGYSRFSLLGAIINSIILLMGSAFVIYKAIPRILEPQQPDAKGMIYLAVLGVIVNGAAMLKLRKGISLNERVISLHLLEDVLGWVAVLIGSIAMYFYDIPILDPILSLLIALFILVNIYKNLKESFKIIMQGKPEGINIDEITGELQKLPGVIEVHDTHAWTMEGTFHVLTAHLVVEGNKNLEELSKLKIEVRRVLALHDIPHATIEFESEDEYCPDRLNS